MEEWKPIPGLIMCEASSLGRIRSWSSRRKEKKIRKLYPNDGGYLTVSLFKLDGKQKTMKVARLILAAFTGQFATLDASHINGIKIDNRIENLIWESRHENVRRKFIHGTQLRGEKIGNSKLKKEDIVEIRRMFDLGSTKYSLSKKYSVCFGAITKICNKETWRHV